MIKVCLLCLWASASALAQPAQQTPAQQPQPPHIIHIMGDDVGWNDLSYHHGSSSHSPNLDFLATNGVRLVNHHAFKVCAPSRCGFHTGRLPWQMGYYDNSGAAVPWLQLDDNRNGAALNYTLLPELLRDHANYTNHAIGKWYVLYTEAAPRRTVVAFPN